MDLSRKNTKRGIRMTETRRRRRRGRGWKLRASLLVVLILASILAFLMASGAMTFALQAGNAITQDAPKLDQQTTVSLAQTSRIYAADGSLLAYLYGQENRTVVSGSDIPQVVKDAIVAIEDRRFYQHNGVDLQGVARALLDDLQAGKIVEGASTITEQLAGTLYLDRSDVSLVRKFKEAELALQLEKTMTKDQILEAYLNTVYFGSNAYGVKAASQTYFAKDPDKLTLAEAALLAGLVQAPSAYSPRLHPTEAHARRDQVLLAMHANGFITAEQYDAAVNAPLVLSTVNPYSTVQEPYVVAYVRQQLVAMFGEDRVLKGGLNVETTINPAYQTLGVEAIKSTLNQPGDPTAAMVAVDPRSGYIQAMVSGTDFSVSQFNLAAQARRQPGSCFKMFVLAAAVEMGMDPFSTYYESKPLSLTIPGHTLPWSVETYSNTYAGDINVAKATWLSDNTVYAQLVMDVGADRVVDIAHRMGITSYLNADPPIAIGGLTYGVSPLEMASAFGTLANQGSHVEPVIILRVTDATGKVVYEAKPRTTQAISAGVAYEVTSILHENTLVGTATAAYLPDRPVAGKTGTAQDWHDAWFSGYIPQLSAAVWVGYPQSQIPMTDVHGIRVTGGSFPAEIWNKFMSQATKGVAPEDFAVPVVPASFSQWISRYDVAPPRPTTTSSTTTSSTTTSTQPSQPTTTLPTSTTGGGRSSTTTSTTKPVPVTTGPTTAPPPTTGPPPPSA